MSLRPSCHELYRYMYMYLVSKRERKSGRKERERKRRERERSLSFCPGGQHLSTLNDPLSVCLFICLSVYLSVSVSLSLWQVPLIFFCLCWYHSLFLSSTDLGQNWRFECQGFPNRQVIAGDLVNKRSTLRGV